MLLLLKVTKIGHPEERSDDYEVDQDLLRQILFHFVVTSLHSFRMTATAAFVH